MENTLHILTQRVISCFDQWILLTAWPWTLTLVSWLSVLKAGGWGWGTVLSTNRNWLLTMNEYTCPHLSLIISQLWWPLWILPRNRPAALLPTIASCFSFEELPSASGYLLLGFPSRGLNISLKGLHLLRVGEWACDPTRLIIVSHFGICILNRVNQRPEKMVAVFYQAVVPRGAQPIVPAAQTSRTLLILHPFMTRLFSLSF